MTQEFEEWFNPLRTTTMVHETAVKVFAERAWQASREQLKAKLLSDEMGDIVAKAICKEWHSTNVKKQHTDWCVEKFWQRSIPESKAALEAIVREL